AEGNGRWVDEAGAGRGRRVHVVRFEVGKGGSRAARGMGAHGDRLAAGWGVRATSRGATPRARRAVHTRVAGHPSSVWARDLRLRRARRPSEEPWLSRFALSSHRESVVRPLEGQSADVAAAPAPQVGPLASLAALRARIGVTPAMIRGAGWSIGGTASGAVASF